MILVQILVVINLAAMIEIKCAVLAVVNPFPQPFIVFVASHHLTQIAVKLLHQSFIHGAIGGCKKHNLPCVLQLLQEILHAIADTHQEAIIHKGRFRETFSFHAGQKLFNLRRAILLKRDELAIQLLQMRVLNLRANHTQRLNGRQSHIQNLLRLLIDAIRKLKRATFLETLAQCVTVIVLNGVGAILVDEVVVKEFDFETIPDTSDDTSRWRAIIVVVCDGIVDANLVGEETNIENGVVNVEHDEWLVRSGNLVVARDAFIPHLLRKSLRK
mmetsp:Transcript_33106/g.53818  ORF Transcript_33106/g.53818 Transcript_33106/m.53818 type:complete len:272 (-) Transcript_33106:128-943(-)